MTTQAQIESRISRIGESAAQGGYFPQYEEFSICVYDAIVSDNLEEIRVADTEENVGKLDDIVYVTEHDVYAYQVKWTTETGPMSYPNFKQWMPGIVDGWKNLKRLYPEKTIHPKLLTNKTMTGGDYTIRRLAGKDAGGFAADEREVLRKLKSGQPIGAKWQKALTELKSLCGFTSSEWDEFWKEFAFDYAYIQETIKIEDAQTDLRKRDIISINRLIHEIVGRSDTANPISVRTIISRLGWNNRLKLIYDHNLSVPEDSYVPNAKGLALLDKSIDGKAKGYVFLKGTPGSGKSTLLTQWIRRRENPSVRFYAFDFLNPSSQRNNDSSRGSSITFLNDIVKQIHKTGVLNEKTLPPLPDLSALKTRFYEQLSTISENYRQSGIPFLIVVDGLDHITREYKNSLNTLMDVLPAPVDIPEGVIFVLGSQHFDHLGLNQSIELESQKAGNLIEMPPLSRSEADDLCTKLLDAKIVTDDVKDKCWRKSQGHPLYLRYLLNQVAGAGVAVLKPMDDTPEGVDEYYARIIGPLLEKAKLKNDLGIISRISGTIKLADVRILCDADSQMDIRNKMWHLFRYDKAGQELTIFHNSFRQYLLNKTAEDILTGEYCHEVVVGYYKTLADHFKNSWDRGYYLYMAEEYDKFIQEITPEILYKQAQNYRPLWSLQRDMERGVEIARMKKDPYLLLRYFLLDNQLGLMGNQDYSVLDLVEYFISSGRDNLAKAIVREGRQLHCTQEFAMSLAIIYLKQGDREEANLLFELSYPDFLSKRPEEHHYQYDDLRQKTAILMKWIETAGYFLSWKDIEGKISLFLNYLQGFAAHDNARFNAKDCERQFKQAYLESLVEQERWDEFENILLQQILDKKNARLVFNAYDNAIVYLSQAPADDRRLRYFTEIEKLYKSIGESPKGNLRMSYLAMQSEQSSEKVSSYLQNVRWEDLGSFYQSEVQQNFSTLSSHIYYVKLRARLGIKDEMLSLVPNDKSHEDNDLMVNYARRLFTIAQMAGKAQEGTKDSSFLSMVKVCISQFDYYKNPVPHNRYSYTLSQQRGDYYEFIVESAKCFGVAMLDTVAKEFESYFSQGTCKAEAEYKRQAILELYRTGYNRDWCIEQLDEIGGSMLNWQDIDGREKAIYKQGQALLEVGCEDNAEKCFHQMIEETFGVGYRKDYQPTLFAEWIGDAIDIYPEKAEYYIHWLTARLKNIDEIAENRTGLRAAETLLDRTLKFNLRSGLKLAIWLLDEEYDYFNSVSSDLLEALLERAATESDFSCLFRYYTDIYLYTDDNDKSALNTSLMRSVVSVGQRIMGNKFDSIVEILRRRISTECQESVTEEMLKSLDNILLKKETERSKYNRESDEKLTEAKKLLESGEQTAAWDKAMEALERSTPSGWAKCYDGGSRIKICRTLQQINEAKGRECTRNLFASDISRGYTFAVMDCLDEIMSLLDENVDKGRVFDEEFAYMNRILREDTSRGSGKPDVSQDESTVCEILRDWLLCLASLPVICVAERAKMLLAYLYDESNISFIPVMRTSNAPKRMFLEIGCYLVELSSNRLSDFAGFSKGMAFSDNYQFRIYAARMLIHLGEHVPKAPYRSLPATYSMVFSETESPLSWLSGENHIGEVDWEDASSIMSVASHWSGYLEYCTGYEKRTLDYRAVQLMKQNGNEKEIDNHATQRSSSHQEKIGLRYSSKKAHVDAAFDGMLAVAAELMDGKAGNSRCMDSIFIPRDFGNIRIEAREKPSFIQRIAGEDAWSADKNWINEASSSPRLTGGLPEYQGGVVIGEYCHIKKMRDIEPLEEFQAKISFYSLKTDSKTSDIFGDSPFMHDTADYLRTGLDDPELIVLRGGYFTDFTNKSHWLAINPTLAFTLGLSPCDDGYFAWKNAKGEKVVESFYWQSGNINASSLSHYETGEGWIVVAKKEILAAIWER